MPLVPGRRADGEEETGEDKVGLDPGAPAGTQARDPAKPARVVPADHDDAGIRRIQPAASQH
jgi:hypothetical protein